MSAELTDLFDQLYRDNQARVYRLALGLTGRPGDAEGHDSFSPIELAIPAFQAKYNHSPSQNRFF
ncbi:MAG: hypothetical protein KBA08_02295 [Firmicutes bacterium]|nr:hypothetical protein [Bacillota bacterium]